MIVRQLYPKTRGVATYAQKSICVHICTKHIHYSDGSLVLCVQNVCVEPILMSLYPILREFVMMFVSPHHRHPPINALPRVSLSWQTANTLMRRRVLRRLIWVYAACIWSFFACIQPVPQVRTFNFRLLSCQPRVTM